MMKRFWRYVFLIVTIGLLVAATTSYAIYTGAELGYIDNVTVNDQEMENFDEHQIVFYPEDLVDGIVEICGLLESEQENIPVSSLQVQVSLDGGRSWQSTTGHDRWRFRFHPQLEKTYNFTLRVVTAAFTSPKLAPLAPLPMELRPVLTTLKPNRWLPGKSYTVSVTGLLLDKVETISFGSGIQVDNFQHKGDKQLSFRVTLGKKLPPSVRFSTVELQRRIEKTSVRVWVLKPPSKFGKLPSLVWKPEEKLELRQGKIFLQTPEWSFSGDMANNHHPVPALNDMTVLTWKEETPGLADIFEVRFFSPSGTLIATKTLNLQSPNLYTTAFKPGSQFLTRLFNLVSKGKQQIKSINGEPVVSTANASEQVAFSLQPPVFPTTSKPAAANAKLLTPAETYIRDNKEAVNLLWQVVGLKSITTTTKQQGVAESQLQQQGKQQIKTTETKLVEMEVSEKWPLHLPDYSPTGMTCDEKNQFELSQVDWSHPEHKNPEDLLHYPGDTLTIGGEVSLNSSPWAVSAQTTYAGGASISDESYQFNNVIVDWGDGQWTQLNAKAAKPSLPGWSNTDTLNFRENHTYSYPGKFEIRLYVVPQDQMGQVGAIVAAHSTLSELSSSTEPNGLIFQQTSTQISEDPGSRLFMLYCNPMDVTIIQDTAATGPLNLDSIEITSFSSDATKEIILPGKKLQQRGSIKSIAVKNEVPISANTSNLSLATNPAKVVSVGEDTRVSSCAGGLWAKGTLSYFGQGYARIQWLVDGVVIDSREIKIESSQLRKDLTSSDPDDWREPLRSVLSLDSPRLPISDIALHHVQLSAVVVPDPTWSKVNAVALHSALVSYNKKSSNNTKGRAPKALTPNAHAEKGLKPVFSPLVPNASGEKDTFKQSGALAAILKEDVSARYLKPGLNLFQPPYSVISPEKRYLVVKNTKNTLCQMSFPTQEGVFEIAGLKNLHGQDGIYNGNGLLIYKLADGGPGSSSEHYIPIKFDQWQVSTEDTLVQQGNLDIDVNETLDSLPGMKATLKKMVGNAGEHLSATMNITVGDPTVRLSGREEPQTWKNVSSILSSAGDWYASGHQLGHSLIGWSMTSMEATDVSFDLSHKEGKKPSCGYGSGTDWVGIYLGVVTLHPYTFDLADVLIQSSGWSIASKGLCGQAETGPFSHSFGQGKIGWEKMTVNAFQGNLYSHYDNFYVNMDWPKIHLESAKTTFNYSPGSHVDVQLGFDHPPTVTEKYDHINMKVLSKSFSHTENGWGLMADAELTFRDRRGKLFADKVTVNDLFFSINDYAVYQGGAIPLDIKGQVDGADELITSLALSTGKIDNHKKMTLDFTTEFSLEGMGRSKEPVHIIYGISKQPHQPAISVNPKFPSEIILESEFPDTNSATSNKVSINYGQSGSGSSDGSVGNCGNDTFAGHINTKMFGSLAYVEGTFRFGTLNGNRYWLGYLKGDKLHVPIYTEVYLEMVQGGLAYNFDHNAFNHDGGYTACPSPGKGLLFSAGLGLKIGEGDVIRADGILTIQPADSFYQVDVHALLFSVADLSGRLRYWNSAFDGEIWGNASLLDDQIRIVAPEHSCGIHVDANTWKFFMGSRDNPVTGHVTSIVSGYTYLTLGNENGFLVGAGVDYEYGRTYHGFGFRGTLSVAGEISLTTSPLRFDGRIDGDVSGKFINPVKDLGVNVNSNAHVGCCNPTKFGFGFSTSCCCVEGGVDIDVLPSPGISGHAGCTCCDPTEWF